MAQGQSRRRIAAGFAGLLIAAGLLAARPPAAQAHVNLAAVPISRMSLPWWRHRFEMTLREAKRDHDARLIWLGDSITEYWQRTGPKPFEDIEPVWDKYYAPYDPLDFGFIGDTTASVIWRLDHGQLDHLHPRLVIILIGANNLGRPHWGWRKTVPGIEAVVANVHRRVPQANILLLGVLPSIRSAWISAQTRIINAKLATIYAHGTYVTFRNVGHVLETDGRPDPALYMDPHFAHPEPALHPDRAGMRRIAETLAPTVTRLMK